MNATPIRWVSGSTLSIVCAVLLVSVQCGQAQQEREHSAPAPAAPATPAGQDIPAAPAAVEPAAAAVTAAAGAGHDWPNWRGPHRDGISRESGWNAQWPADGPPVRWEKSVGAGQSTVAVAAGRLYVLGNRDGKDTVYCLDPASGDELWTFSYDADIFDKQHEGGPSATPLVDDGRLYTLSKHGELYCFDAANGNVLWQRQLTATLGVEVPTWGFSGSPVVEGRRLILDAGVIAAFDKASGELLWQTENYGPAYSTPQPFDHGGKRLLACFPEHGLVIVSLEDGRELAKTRWQTSYGVNAATPIVHGDRIYISSGYNTGGAVYVFTGDELRELWRNKVMSNHFATSILHEGHLYGYDDSRLKCVEFATGKERWVEPSTGKATLTMAGDTLIVLSERGELMTAKPSPAGFEPISRAQVLGGRCWVVPVFSHGLLYCRNNAGELVCLELRDDG